MKLSESDPIVRGIRIKGLKTSHTHNTSYQNIDINSKINTLPRWFISWIFDNKYLGLLHGCLFANIKYEMIFVDQKNSKLVRQYNESGTIQYKRSGLTTRNNRSKKNQEKFVAVSMNACHYSLI